MSEIADRKAAQAAANDMLGPIYKGLNGMEAGLGFMDLAVAAERLLEGVAAGVLTRDILRDYDEAHAEYQRARALAEQWIEV